MRKLLSALIILAVGLSFTACGPKTVPANSGEKEIALPFSTAEYKTDKDYFRSVSQGVSPDMATAEKIALLNARTQLAGNVSTTIKAVTEQYINQVAVGDKMEYASKFEENARSVVNQEISGVAVKDKKMFRSDDGKYTCWIAIEMAKSELVEKISDSITDDQKLKLEFDKYQFQKVFDSEMEKFENR